MGLMVHLLQMGGNGGVLRGQKRWYLRNGRGKMGEWTGCRKQDPWEGPQGEAARVSYIVMHEKGDPVGGIVQEHQPLQEARQERSRLFHKHGQKHPGGRLEDA